jgi:hypothetical protein
MGLAKKTDGRYVVGKGIDDANDYKGSAAWRDMVIQLTESGATEKSEEYLNYLKDYALNANSLGEPIMPPSVDVWISNHGTTTAVEADDVAIDGANYTICGIKWDGSAWDYTNAGQGSGGGGSSLPSYSSSDIGKVLTIGEGESTETVIVPAQDIQLTDSNGAAVGEVEDADIEAFSNLQDGDSVVFVANGVVLPTTEVHRIEDEFGNVTIDVAGFVNPAQGLYSLSYEVGGNNIMFRYMTQGGILPKHMPLSLSVSVPSAKPKWEAASGGTFIVDDNEGVLDKTAGEIMSALTMGKDVVISHLSYVPAFNYVRLYLVRIMSLPNGQGDVMAVSYNQDGTVNMRQYHFTDSNAYPAISGG